MPSRNIDDACSIHRQAVPHLIGLYNGRYSDKFARVGEVLRTDQEQLSKWQQGRGLPGKIVTNADGTRIKSAHQAALFHGENASHAVDIDVLSPDGKTYVTHEQAYWPLIGLATAVGIVSGGDWMKPDLPHLACPYFKVG